MPIPLGIIFLLKGKGAQRKDCKHLGGDWAGHKKANSGRLCEGRSDILEERAPAESPENMDRAG